MDAGAGWTEERVAQLAKLWAEGLSASQIAGIMGGGVTRNAVIGKVHRLGLAGRAKTGQTPPPRPAAAKAKAPAAAQPTLTVVPSEEGDGETAAEPVRAVARPVEPAIPVSERVTILELRDSMCRWPLGDPTSADFGFCGGRTVTGHPYCSAHCRIAYQPAADRRRLRAF